MVMIDHSTTSASTSRPVVAAGSPEHSLCKETILVADDDGGLCLGMENVLARVGFDVVCTHTGRETIEWLRRYRPRLLLLDARLPDMASLEVVEMLAHNGWQVPYLVVSGLSDTKMAVEYMRRGARDYLLKDSNFLEIVPAVVERVLHDIERDEQIARLQREILEISEREQRRIGQDLHDDLCQRLAAIKMAIHHLSEDLTTLHAGHSRKAAAIADQLAGATRAARALARGLSPVDIGHEGLAAALSGLARNAEEVFHIQCKFRAENPCPMIDHHAATQLYRIAQEAVANAVRHGRASLVTISLRCDPSNLVLTIANNGEPFRRNVPHGGIGLHLMRLRAESIGAPLQFLENPAVGGTFAVQVTFPMP
jgi:signal transduction histidine kinase